MKWHTWEFILLWIAAVFFVLAIVMFYYRPRFGKPEKRQVEFDLLNGPRCAAIAAVLGVGVVARHYFLDWFEDARGDTNLASNWFARWMPIVLLTVSAAILFWCWARHRAERR